MLHAEGHGFVKDLWSGRVLGVVGRKDVCLPSDSDVNRDFRPSFRFCAARLALDIGGHHLDRDKTERGISGKGRIEMEDRPKRCSVKRNASVNPLDSVAPNLETEHGHC
jgi:hypothetical protein